MTIIFRDDVIVEYRNRMGSDDEILEAARVSTKGVNAAYNERTDRIVARIRAGEDSDTVFAEEEKRDKGLINFLMRDRHGSPFEHCVLKVYVKAPIFVFREWQRHRIASYNEMSGRYTELFPEFYVPAKDRPIRQVGKPGAYSFEPGTLAQIALSRVEAERQAVSAWESYQRQLEAGIAKEIARIVLPVSTYSQMYCTMNLRALMNFLSLRTKTKENSKVPSFPQHEISLGADKLEALFKEHFPWTHEAFEANGRVAP